jgi:hypothetical protein
VIRTVDYKKIAFSHYQRYCVYCGYGIAEILQVAHLNHNHKDHSIDNLIVLCPTCHRMYDGGLIPEEYLRDRRDNPPRTDWSKCMKDAGIKAARTRKARLAARKAVKTRQARQSAAKRKQSRQPLEKGK